jgi:NitT/TauT family transport system substrate-binding protein
VEIGPVPGLGEGSVSFGVNAARALREGVLDGFWANGMGAEVAVQEGIGSVVLDVRRGDGPPAARDYTFAALVARDDTLRDDGDLATAMVRGLVRAHSALREDPERATPIGQQLFPPREAGLIATLIARDVPYYDASITPDVITPLDAFCRNAGLTARRASYKDIVASDLRRLWSRGDPSAEARA